MLVVKIEKAFLIGSERSNLDFGSGNDGNDPDDVY